MSKELEEKITTVENLTKKQMIDVIKTGKIEHDSSGQRSFASKSNIMQDNTSEIIEKINSKIPSYVQHYSNLYKKYLHIANNFCNTSFLAQKEFFNKIRIDDARLTMFDSYLESVKNMVLFQIDLNENMIKSYVDNRLMFLDFYDQMLSRNIIIFTKMFSMINNLEK